MRPSCKRGWADGREVVREELRQRVGFWGGQGSQEAARWTSCHVLTRQPETSAESVRSLSLLLWKMGAPAAMREGVKAALGLGTQGTGVWSQHH